MESDRETKEQLREELRRLRRRIAALEAAQGGRDQAQESLRQERDRLHRILDVMADGVYVCSPDYDIEYVNPVLTRDFGAVSGRKCFEYFHGRSDICPWCKMPEVLAGKTVRSEWHSEKTGKTYELVETRVEKREGGIAKLKVFHDVTHRKKAEQALKRSEERYALAEKAAGIGSWDWDILAGQLHWSEAIEPMFGFERGEFAGTYEAFLECVHPEDRRYVSDEVDACIETGKEYGIEHRIVWPDGTVRWVSETGDVIRDGNGKAARMLGIVQDITVRKHAEDALRNERALLAAVLRQMPAGVAVLEAPSGEIILANKQAEDLLEISRQKAGSSPQWEELRIFRPDGRPFSKQDQPLLQALRGGKTVENEEILLQRSDGSFRTLLVSAAPVSKERDQVVAAVATCYDISDRKYMEDGLRRAREELEERVRRRTEELAAANRVLRDEVAERRRAQDRISNTNALMDLFVRERTRQGYLDGVVHLLRRVSGCTRVGVRLRSSGNYIPYEASAGFSKEFLESECWLQMGRDECACTRIVAGRALPQDASVMTPAGSFLCNDTSRFISGLSEEQRRAYRGVCVESGFASLAVVPIRYHDRILGAVHLAHEKPHMLSKDTIEFLEATSPLVGEAIYRLDVQEKLRSLASELSLAEERERRRIATHLHDYVSQTLALGKIKLGALQQSVSDPKAEEAFEDLRRHLNQAIQYTRSLTFDLSPPVLYEMGMEAALQALTEKVAEEHGIAIEFEDDGRSKPLTDDLRVVLFQSARELLINIVKHASAARAKVSVKRDGEEIRVRVEDDGSGFDVLGTGFRPYKEGGFGLFNVRERLDRLGGRLELWSEPAKGTTATLVVPVEKQQQ